MGRKDLHPEVCSPAWHFPHPMAEYHVITNNFSPVPMFIHICHNLNLTQRPLKIPAPQSVLDTNNTLGNGKSACGNYQFNLDSLVIWEALFHVTGKLAGELLPFTLRWGWGGANASDIVTRQSLQVPSQDTSPAVSRQRQFLPHRQPGWGHETCKNGLSRWSAEISSAREGVIDIFLTACL